MNILNLFKKDDRQQEVLEALKKQDSKRFDDELDAVKRLNKAIRIVTNTGDIEILIRNVEGVMKELKK